MGTAVIADSFGDTRCARSLVCGTRKTDQLKGGWAPSKIRGGEFHTSPRFCLDHRSLSLSLGDLKWKPWGVTAEPEVKTKLVESQCGCMPHLRAHEVYF
jgi:hypothetical protein